MVKRRLASLDGSHAPDNPTETTDEARGVRLMPARQQTATFYEAIDFIDGARRQVPRVACFVGGLGTAAQEHYGKTHRGGA
jgi:hypothetical protein